MSKLLQTPYHRARRLAIHRLHVMCRMQGDLNNLEKRVDSLQRQLNHAAKATQSYAEMAKNLESKVSWATAGDQTRERIIENCKRLLPTVDEFVLAVAVSCFKAAYDQAVDPMGPPTPIGIDARTRNGGPSIALPPRPTEGAQPQLNQKSP